MESGKPIRQSPIVFRFPEELIVRETVPGQDTSKELEEIMHSSAKCEVNYLNDYGHTVLGTSAFLGSLKCCEILVRLGADVAKQDIDGWTALHYALAKGYLDVARYLIFHGSNLFAVNNDGDAALDFVDDDDVKEALICYQKKCLKTYTEL